MKVLGVSLGTSERNFYHSLKVLGQEVIVERIGTEGSLGKAKNLLEMYDGKVDVIALGGVNLNYILGERKYPIREGQFLAKTLCKTPIVDGENIKKVLEVATVNYLQEKKIVNFNGAKVFFVSVLDRYNMAERMVEAGSSLIIGDALLALKLPIPFSNLKFFNFVGKATLPLLRYIPLSYLYPLGKQQVENKPKYEKIFKAADIIAGDFHFIHRYMPDDLKGKTIITSTVTKSDVSKLEERGVKCLVTTSPQFEGRSYGSNILEGLFLLLKKNRLPLQPSEVEEIAVKIGWQPRVEYLGDYSKEL